MKLSPMKFSPPALVGGVRGRVSELAGGVIIRKDKAPPASALALAPPPKAGGEMRCGTCTPLESRGEMRGDTCIKFSPSALVGGVRGRDSELAGGVIIRKDKAPPASALALAPPPKAEGERRCGTCTPLESRGEMRCGTCIKFSPPALVGGVRGRVSELAGGVIIRKDKAPPASALALAPPPKAGGERRCGTCTPLESGGEIRCGTCTPLESRGEMRCGICTLSEAGGEMGYGEIYSCLARQQLRHKKIVAMGCDLMALCYNTPYNALRGLYYDKHC